jgi:hypothetical protein
MGREAEARPRDRRTFVKHAAIAAAGAAVAGPIVGAKSASAATTTLEGDQRVNGRLGVGVEPTVPLQVARTDAGAAVRVDAHTMGLYVRHDRDWAGETYDLVNLDHASTGDAVFIFHGGGKPPGFTGITGGNAALNVLIPYYSDARGDGRTGGTTLNDRTGMRGLFIQSQSVTDAVKAIHVQHFTNDVAAYFEIQPPGYRQPVGKGGGLLIDDWSAENTIRLRKPQTPGFGRALLSLEAKWDASGGTNAGNALQVLDSTGYTRASLGSSGKLSLFDDAHVTRVIVASDGSASFGGSQRFGSKVRIASEFGGAGVQRNLALINAHGSAGDGAQIEFDDAGSQNALIAASFDNVSAGSRSASLKFSVRSADAMTERLRLNGTGIGFFGAPPVARPVVSGSRGDGSALGSLLNALSRLGLVSDSSTS